MIRCEVQYRPGFGKLGVDRHNTPGARIGFVAFHFEHQLSGGIRRIIGPQREGQPGRFFAAQRCPGGTDGEVHSLKVFSGGLIFFVVFQAQVVDGSPLTGVHPDADGFAVIFRHIQIDGRRRDADPIDHKLTVDRLVGAVRVHRTYLVDAGFTCQRFEMVIKDTILVGIDTGGTFKSI